MGWVEAREGEHLTVFASFKLAPESRNGREQLFERRRLLRWQLRARA
jgi:hypothetical protein